MIAPEKDVMPPIAAATKPEIVNRRPVSNCSDVVGATITPEMAAIRVASAKLRSVIRATLIPINDAAAGFSAQARRPLPSLVFAMRYHNAAMQSATEPKTHKACVGRRIAPNTRGVSPEKGGMA